MKTNSLERNTMQYIGDYHSPLGNMLLAADDIGLTGAWFEGQAHFARTLRESAAQPFPILDTAKAWLELYFSGKEPHISLPLHLTGTPFQLEAWELLCAIPYGKTVTYGQLAEALAAKRGLQRMSAQAVGAAVGRNPIAVIVPCHRVLGADGSLTGYAAGIDKKRALLELEKQAALLT